MLATAPICRIRPTLKTGSQGSDVKALQEQLNLRFGYHQQLWVDGIFGPRTKRAVEVMQYRLFLAQDGIVGAQTWAALCGSRPAQPVLRRNSQGVLVIRVQQVLKKSNFYQSAVDGIFGELTEKAVKALQRDQALPMTGIIDSATWIVLAELANMQTIVF